MVSLIDRIRVCRPGVTFGVEPGGARVVVRNVHDGDGAQLVHWPRAAGKRPTRAELRAVTAEQVAELNRTERVRAAIALLDAGESPLGLLIRAAISAAVGVVSEQFIAWARSATAAVDGATSLHHLQDQWPQIVLPTEPSAAHLLARLGAALVALDILPAPSAGGVTDNPPVGE